MVCSGGEHQGSTEDWPFVLLSDMAGTPRMGRYLGYPIYREAGHRSNANLHLSLLHAAGMETPETLGKLASNLKDLDLKGLLPVADLTTRRVLKVNYGIREIRGKDTPSFLCLI